MANYIIRSNARKPEPLRDALSRSWLTSDPILSLAEGDPKPLQVVLYNKYSGPEYINIFAFPIKMKVNAEVRATDSLLRDYMRKVAKNEYSTSEIITGASCSSFEDYLRLQIRNISLTRDVNLSTEDIKSCAGEIIEEMLASGRVPDVMIDNVNVSQRHPIINKLQVLLDNEQSNRPQAVETVKAGKGENEPGLIECIMKDYQLEHKLVKIKNLSEDLKRAKEEENQQSMTM